MINNVPFVPNSADDLHCMQAAYLMIAKYFKPTFNMDWNEWSKITGFEKDKGTWASAGLLWFHTQGFEVKHISLFNYDTFIHDGADYLLSEFGHDVGSWQIEHSNIPLEQARAVELLRNDIVEFKEPMLEDITRYLDQGYLVRCMINMAQLNNIDGYIGHAIVVSRIENDKVVIQDPGLPAEQNRIVSVHDFEKAWASPNREAKELDAIKLTS